jgi:predicted flap endonuclease-1-like 5' DNA nuclease
MASIDAIEGIGETYRRRLLTQGIRTCEKLLRMGSTPLGRHAIATRCGVDTGLVLEWVNRADLMRVRGVASQYSDLLEAAGVDSVAELAGRDPDHLTASIVELNAAKRLVRRVPTRSMVQRWVEHARTLAPAVSH